MLLMSNHDAADTGIILHASIVAKEGHDRVIISSRYADVLVFLLHFPGQLSQEIWFRTGTATQRRFVPVHEFELGHTMCQNRPAYHTITGCNTIIQLYDLDKTIYSCTWITLKEMPICWMVWII